MGISILMAVYAKEKPEYLIQSLESIFAQTLQPDEIYIIVDGRLPNTLEQVLEVYQKKDNRIKITRFQEHVMLGRALRRGVKLCGQELIARMDSDDIAKPERLEKQYAFMQKHKEIDVLGGWIEEFNEENFRQIKKMPVSQSAILRYARYRNPINHMTVMFRKEAVLEAGNYRHFPYLEDYELWNRMLAKGKQFYNLPEILVEMRSGKKVYKRRSGWNYFKMHWKLRKRQKALGNLSFIEYGLSLLFSFGFAIQPAVCRKWTYYLLRNLE